MRKPLLISLLFTGMVLQSVKGVSQAESYSDGIDFAKKILGSPLTLLKDSLRCVDAVFEMYPSPTRRCHAFDYISPDKSIRKFGQYNFSVSFVSTDSTGIVDNVSAMTSYNKTSMPAYQEQFEKDFEELLEYFRTVFKSRGKKGLHYKDQYGKQSNTEWKVDGFVFTLTRDEVKKTDKHNDFYVITFNAYKNNKSAH